MTGNAIAGSSSRTEPPYVFDPPADGRFPVPEPSTSFWLRGVQDDPLLDYRSADGLPAEADVVIIGSGLSGALVAYELLHSPNPPRRVVVLEARQTCSGATGRNAGHCRPATSSAYPKYARLLGADMSLAILRNEQSTFDALVGFIEREGVDCDLWKGQSLEVAMSPEVKEGQLASFEAYKAAGGPTAHITVTTDPAEASKISRLKSAQSILAWEAGSLYPWKLVAHLIRRSLERGLNLQTTTRVESVTSSEEQGIWAVNTPRGSVRTRSVVHATNAFASTLLPLLGNDLIAASAFPCNKITPPPTFSGADALRHSYGILMPGGTSFSINPRFNSDGILLFGGNNPAIKDLTQMFLDHPSLEADDRIDGYRPVTQAVAKLAEGEFEGWGKFDESTEENFDWTGIIGMTKDTVPFVGRVPGLEGQFVSAGHCGHGMARIFTTSPALAKMVLDPSVSFSQTGLPGAFEITAERVASLRDKPRPGRNMVLGQVEQAKL